MKFRSAQLNFLYRLIPVIVAVCSVFPALAQDVAEEPAQSVLKEEPSAEEPNEFTPPAITLGSAAGENPGEFAFKPSTFEGIVPGISKMAEVTEKLGDPRAKIETTEVRCLFIPWNLTTVSALSSKTIWLTRSTYTSNNRLS